MCIWFHQTTVRLSWFFVQINILEGSWLCLNGSRFSHYFIFIPLSDNRNSKIYQFYWEFSFIKIQYVGTERETNVIINVHFAFSEEELPCVQKCKQVCVSKLLSAKKEVMGTWYLFFHVSNRHEQVLWKTSMTFETCLLFMLYVDYGFNNNKHTLYCQKYWVAPF